MNAETLVSRIRQLLDWQQLSPTQFADRIGVGRPVVSHILSGRNNASLDVALRISEAFPELSLNWLLKGAGNMLAAMPASAAPAPTAAEPTRLAAPPAAPPKQVVMAADSAATPLVARQPPPRPAVARFRPVKPAAVSVETPAPPVLAESPPGYIPEAMAPPAATGAALPPAPAAPEAPATGEPPASAGEAASLLAGFTEPGKAIRRIVIFYRDGSFADYQPEA